ncbi:hypothetical protein EmuJ_000335000 [Echinococcus multilocularis]|uniref:Uncharacterized protein n=1 Tax=Echinococcus multilocularis TaxID=6211 RepID=A0A068Y2D8_ECHMU|nr:hypothetical protein EmuJ_000335000 [Echinococcus multilocularis]
MDFIASSAYYFNHKAVCASNWFSASLFLAMGFPFVRLPVIQWVVVECACAVWNAVGLIQAPHLWRGLSWGSGLQISGWEKLPGKHEVATNLFASSIVNLFKSLHFSLIYALPPLFIIAAQIFDLTDTYPALFYLLAVLCLWIIYELLGVRRVIYTCAYFLLPWATCTAVRILYMYVKVDRLLAGLVPIYWLLKWISGEQLRQQLSLPPSRICRSSECGIRANLPTTTLHPANSNRHFRHRQIVPQLLPPFPPDSDSFEESAQEMKGGSSLRPHVPKTMSLSPVF